MIVRRFISVVLTCIGLLAAVSCAPKTRPFDAAHLAAREHDISTLRSIVATNPAVLMGGSGFDGSTLLHAALVNGSPCVECVEFLLKAGADANKPDRTGQYPIHVVCRYNGNVECLNLLLEYGADPSVPWGGRQTPIELAQEHGFTGAVEVLKAAIQKNAGTNAPASGNQTNHSRP
jgi:ankyrin repeat protein